MGWGHIYHSIFVKVRIIGKKIGSLHLLVGPQMELKSSCLMPRVITQPVNLPTVFLLSSVFTYSSSQSLNRYTIKESDIPPTTSSQEFLMKVLVLMDIFSSIGEY